MPFPEFGAKCFYLGAVQNTAKEQRAPEGSVRTSEFALGELYRLYSLRSWPARRAVAFVLSKQSRGVQPFVISQPLRND